MNEICMIDFYFLLISFNQHDIILHRCRSIVGESREHCVVIGGLLIVGKNADDVNVSDLTLRGSNGYGVSGSYNRASMHLDNVSVEYSGRSHCKN